MHDVAIECNNIWFNLKCLFLILLLLWHTTKLITILPLFPSFYGKSHCLHIWRWAYWSLWSPVISSHGSIPSDLPEVACCHISFPLLSACCHEQFTSTTALVVVTALICVLCTCYFRIYSISIQKKKERKKTQNVNASISFFKNSLSLWMQGICCSSHPTSSMLWQECLWHTGMLNHSSSLHSIFTVI